jgi:hypothetical protein
VPFRKAINETTSRQVFQVCFCTTIRLREPFGASNETMAHWDPQLPVTSSDEPTWTHQEESSYRDALRALLDAGLPFVVGGAFAIHRHTGIWRTTKDLDFFLPPQAIPEALKLLRGAGFETAIEDPVWLAKARRGENFIDLITGLGNASQVVDDTWVERGLPETVLGVPCRVLGAEECVASKTFVAFRERFDGADVAHLIKACGPRLDWDRVRALMGEHWQLLYWSLVFFAYVYPAHTDAVPAGVWTGLTQRFTECVQNPNRDEPFRGSLLDPRMFAIDVNEWGERDLYKELCEQHRWLLRESDARESEG